MAEAVIVSSPASPANRIAIYPLILALGALLWWGSTFHAGAMPSWAPFEFSWAWFLTTALTLSWYARGYARMDADARPRPWRVAVFLLGVGIIYVVLQTHYEYMAEHMFFLNRAQHIVMHHLGPFLIALAWPGAVLLEGIPTPVRRLIGSRPVRFAVGIIQEPFLAAVLFVGLIALWLWPPVHFRAMIDPKLYTVMNWSMVVDGIFFWCLVLDPRPAPQAFTSFGTRAALPMLIMFPQIAIGALIAFAGHDIYTFYAWCGRLYPSIDALDDQKYGGLIVWIPAAMMSVISLLVVINALRLSEESMESQNDDSAEGIVFSSKQWTGR